ncbi:hypothetical protein Tco_1228002 [Tanacetum coccineum]
MTKNMLWLYETLRSSLKGRVDLLDNHDRRRIHSDKGMIRNVRVIGNALDAVIRIISLVNVQSLYKRKNKEHLLGVLRVIAKMNPRTKPMNKLVSWLNRQMSDNASSLDDDNMQIEYNILF